MNSATLSWFLLSVALYLLPGPFQQFTLAFSLLRLYGEVRKNRVQVSPLDPSRVLLYTVLLALP